MKNAAGRERAVLANRGGANDRTWPGEGTVATDEKEHGVRTIIFARAALMSAVVWASGCAVHETAPTRVESSGDAAVFGPADQETILLTIVLKHDQSKTLSEIQQHLGQTGFWKTFPPEGIEVESWKIVMGMGQVVTLKVPPSRLREVNRAIEVSAWGAYRTEFYPTYDFMSVATEQRAKALGEGK